jgi:eukaryotic-like serine/threonine-protein kinase
MQCMNLKCPNLLTIFDLKANDAGDSFVIMEYVAGPSLANVLKQYPEGLPQSEVRHWLKGLVEGVAYLHDHGIVHRDLKPANLFMEEGIVKIGDYGLAKLITPSQGSEHSESIGTCHYMAPEVGSGKYHKPIDVYAIGVILYEMLTGHVPFDGETVNEVLMKHLTARPDLSILSEPFRTIVGKALAKDPILRPERVYDLLPSEDAPRIPDVRIIGEGKKGTVPPSTGTSPRSEPDDVLHIGAEEPVFYIGPDTRPPAHRQTVQERIRANWLALKQPGAYRRTAVNQARPAPARPQPVAGRPRPAPLPARPAPPRVPPPEPPPIPGARVRVAELTGSMLWAAAMLALLTLPAAVALGVDLERSPNQLAYIYGLGLAGTWAALVANKLFEHRSPDVSTRRFVALIAGLVVGAVAIVLGGAMQVDLPLSRQFINNPQRFEPFYFGLLYAASAGWYGLAARDRRRRFRLIPLFWTALLAAVLMPLWPYERPDGIAVALLVVTTTQIVSPWSELGARYAEYVKAARKQNRKANIA